MINIQDQPLTPNSSFFSSLHKQSRVLTALGEKTFENIVRKRTKCWHFTLSRINSSVWATFYSICGLQVFQQITRRQILDSSKLKVFADDNLKFEENGSKLFKPVENTVGKWEIARYEQFLLFPKCFQKACFPGASKGVIVCFRQFQNFVVLQRVDQD